MTARDDAIGCLVLESGTEELLLQPRLASGLGTVYLSVDAAGAGPSTSLHPTIDCVRDTRDEADDGGEWRHSARTDYLWMAKEFNRQYINSHGKEHDDYQPHSADAELQLHYLNGRLWCFFGSVRNATRSLEEATRMDPNHVHSHLLLAKIRIGQGLHEQALVPLDEAARVQPDHWQTHLMRLHCLRALGRLDSAAAAPSHLNVCRHLRLACKDAGKPEAFPLLCEGGGTRVRLDDPSGEASSSSGSGSTSKKGKKAAAAAENTPAPAGRGLYGWHLHSASARRKLRHDRYVVLRKLLPPTLFALLQGWYRVLYSNPKVTAVFQGKTQRHEYLPEVISTYLNFALVPFASAMAGMVVAPTYPFPITYIPGGSIHPHLDVSDNELSLTFQVELRDARAWPLWFLDPRGQELSNLNASTAKEVSLGDNDGILYYGPDIVHWRQQAPFTLTQIVFAFREEDTAHCNNQ